MKRAALIVAAITAALGAALLLLYKQRFEREVSGGPKIGVVMAKEDLPLGAILTEDMIGLRPLPQNYVEERHILATDVNRVVGVRVSQELRAGDTILWSDLAVASSRNRTLASVLHPGKRVVAVPATEQSTFGGLLRPGDRVDALLTVPREGSGELVTLPLLQNLLVLATGSNVGSPQPGTPKRGSSRRTTVSLEVTLQQGQKLTHAMARGQISLVLRDPDDVAVIEEMPETTLSDIVVPARRPTIRRPAPKPVEDKNAVEALR